MGTEEEANRLVSQTMETFLTLKELDGELLIVYNGQKVALPDSEGQSKASQDLTNRFVQRIYERNSKSKVYFTANKFAKFDLVVASETFTTVIELKCREGYDYASLVRFGSVTCDAKKYDYLLKLGEKLKASSYLVTISSDRKIIGNQIYNPRKASVAPLIRFNNAQYNNSCKEKCQKMMAYLNISDAQVLDL